MSKSPNHAHRWQSILGTYNKALHAHQQHSDVCRTRDGTVQITRFNHTRGLCLFVCSFACSNNNVVLYNINNKYTTYSIIPSIIQQYLTMMYYIQSIDQPGLPTRFAVSCAHRQAYNGTYTGWVQTIYNIRFQTIARSVHHVGRSSATSTACESKHEDTYIARAAHTKTLRKGCKHSTHCAMVQPQYEYKHM